MYECIQIICEATCERRERQSTSFISREGKKTIKVGALCDNAIIKCKGSVKNLSFPVFVFNGCRYVVFNWM